MAHNLSLEAAKTILAMKLSRGRPSAEVTALRREAQKVVSSHTISFQHNVITKNDNVVDSSLENQKTDSEKPTYEDLSIEVKSFYLTEEGCLKLEALNLQLDKDYNSLFVNLSDDVVASQWEEFHKNRKQLLDAWLVNRNNLLKHHYLPVTP